MRVMSPTALAEIDSYLRDRSSVQPVLIQSGNHSEAHQQGEGGS